jgi:crotonobetainyl-CoA:carnitine CoA-transferase CaiB-like acyl-CoA transferase
VVEIGQLASSSHAGAVLASLGADVVTMCHSRRAGSRWHGPDPEALDLRHAADRRRFLDRCAGADLVVDNFRDRVWANLDLNPLSAGARMHLRLPAFSSEDARGGWRAFGFQTEALWGVGLTPLAGAAAVVRAPSIGVLDHAAGFAGVALALHGLRAGLSGRLEVTHQQLAALVAPGAVMA